MNAPHVAFDMQSSLSLDLTVSAVPDGVPRMHRHRVAFPWSLGRAFGPADTNGPLRILPQVAGAGLLAGDSRHQRLRVGPGAAARIEDAGSIVVHRGTARPAATVWDYHVGEGACLTVAAEPYSLSPGASLRLRTRISMDPSGVFVGFEGVCLAGGGPADWRSETVVEDPSGAPLLIDRQRAAAADYPRLGALTGGMKTDGANAFGSILILCPPAKMPDLALPLDAPGIYAGLTPLRGGIGVGIRMAASSGGTLRDAALSMMHQLA